MSIYWVLLLVTAFFAYLFGSMDTMILASNFVFHRNLLRLGDESRWFSNFRRLFGVRGFARLLAVELVKDLIPILIGSILLGIRGHADVGRAFAGFVLVLGRLWPALYRLRGSHASVAMIVAAFLPELFHYELQCPGPEALFLMCRVYQKLLQVVAERLFRELAEQRETHRFTVVLDEVHPASAVPVHVAPGQDTDRRGKESFLVLPHAEGRGSLPVILSYLREPYHLTCSSMSGRSISIS